MKFTKPGQDVSKKTKTSLADRSKFKSKDVAAQSGKLQKSAKHAAELIKKGSFDKEVGVLIKNDNNGVGIKKQKKKQTSKPVQLSPEVQMGLKVDKLLSQKIKEQSDETEDSSPSKSGKNKNVNALNNLSSTQSDASPKSNKRKKKGKNKLNIENVNQPKLDTVLNGNQKKSNVDTLSNVSKKQAKKRKAGSMAQSTESDSSPTKKVESESTEEPSKTKKNQSNKKKKGKANQATGGENSQSDKPDEDNSPSSFDTKDFTLNSKDVLKAVKSSITLYNKNMKSSKKLLESEPEPMFLNFLFFIPHTKQKTIRFELTNSLVTDTSDICMFVCDTAKKNADESKAQWEQILRDEKVKNITEVIPLRSLVTDYKQFQDKRKLSERFDFFLVDGKISHRVFGLLGGKFFHSRRKTPTPVMLKKDKMAESINKALQKTVAQYSPAAESFTIQVGHTGMSEKEITENIIKVWEQYPQQFGVYWENIRRASLLIPQTTPLPIFVSLNPPEGAPRVYKNMKWTKDSNVPVVGELSTALDKKVLVYPSGEVIVKHARKIPISDEELLAKKHRKKEKKKLKKLKKQQGGESEDDESLDSDDDLGGRADMLESETDPDEDESSQDEPPRKKKIGGVKDKKLSPAQKKGKQESDDDSDESSIIDESELAYLKELAAAQKAKGAKGKAVVAPKQQASADSDEDSGDTDADDDDSDDSDADDDSIELESDVDIEGSDTEDDSEEEEVVKKPVGKAAKNNKPKNGNVKSTLKMNGAAQTTAKSQMKKVQKKTGATKNVSPQRPDNKKKSNKLTTSTPHQTLGKKNASPSFQGTQANPKQKNKKKGQSGRTTQVFKQKVK